MKNYHTVFEGQHTLSPRHWSLMVRGKPRGFLHKASFTGGRSTRPNRCDLTLQVLSIKPETNNQLTNL